MNNLSLAQEYLLCALNSRGKIPASRFERIIAIAASAVVELLMDDIVGIDGKKLSVQKTLPMQKNYLHPVYDFIKKKQPVKFQKVVEYFSVTLTSKNIDGLISAIGGSLVRAGCARVEKRGLFGSKNAYIPDVKAVDNVIQNIRAEILEDGALSEDIAALTALFNKSGMLLKYFSAYEKKEVKKRLKEIKESPENGDITKVIDYVETLMVILIASAT